MVTISDVAREAGVSLSTVSRVLNNSMLVSQEKKDCVMSTVKRLGYKQIRMTDARKAQQSKIIVFATAMLNANMIDAIREEAERMGYIMLMSYVGEAADGYRNTLNLLKLLPEHLIAGIIFMHNMCQEKEVWAELSAYPNVQIGEMLPCAPLNHITVDDYQAAYDMTNHLIKKGKQKIAFVRSPIMRRFAHTEAREDGFRSALRKAGLPEDDGYFLESDNTMEGGNDIARQVVELKVRPDAIFCCTDQVASGCVTELGRLGVKVPGEIAVCGFDGSEIAEACNPALTTVMQPFEEMGTEAVHMLHMMTTGSTSMGKRVIVSHVILDRGSV